MDMEPSLSFMFRPSFWAKLSDVFDAGMQRQLMPPRKMEARKLPKGMKICGNLPEGQSIPTPVQLGLLQFIAGSRRSEHVFQWEWALYGLVVSLALASPPSTTALFATLPPPIITELGRAQAGFRVALAPRTRSSSGSCGAPNWLQTPVERLRNSLHQM